jgi:hypothetical protein
MAEAHRPFIAGGRLVRHWGRGDIFRPSIKGDGTGFLKLRWPGSGRLHALHSGGGSGDSGGVLHMRRCGEDDRAEKRHPTGGVHLSASAGCGDALPTRRRRGVESGLPWAGLVLGWAVRQRAGRAEREGGQAELGQKGSGGGPSVERERRGGPGRL